jgi:hypothetical protein
LGKRWTVCTVQRNSLRRHCQFSTSKEHKRISSKQIVANFNLDENDNYLFITFFISFRSLQRIPILAFPVVILSVVDAICSEIKEGDCRCFARIHYLINVPYLKCESLIDKAFSAGAFCFESRLMETLGAVVLVYLMSSSCTSIAISGASVICRLLEAGLAQQVYLSSMAMLEVVRTCLLSCMCVD